MQATHGNYSLRSAGFSLSGLVTWVQANHNQAFSYNTPHMLAPTRLTDMRHASTAPSTLDAD